MNESKSFNLMFQCSDCKKMFEVSSDNAPNCLTHKKKFISISDNKSIFLTFYDCPHCGKRHFVQIDTEETLNELREVKKQFIKLSNLRRNDKTISKKQSAKFKKTREHLTQTRTNLMKKYTDKLIHDNETDSDFVLRFSII